MKEMVRKVLYKHINSAAGGRNEEQQYYAGVKLGSK